MPKLRPQRDLAALRERVVATGRVGSTPSTPVTPGESPAQQPGFSRAGLGEAGSAGAHVWGSPGVAPAASRGSSNSPSETEVSHDGRGAASEAVRLQFSLVGVQEQATSLLEVLIGEPSELVLRRLDGRALARLGCCCAELRTLTSSQAQWQRICFAEWGETGWPRLGPPEEEPGGPGGDAPPLSLGERVVRRMQALGAVVDQLTRNKVEEMGAVVRRGELRAADAPANSPLDGLPLDETLGARGGDARGPSCVDWRRTYAHLARMEDACRLSMVRAAMATPGSGRPKSRAALACMGVAARQAAFWVQGEPRGRAAPQRVALRAAAGAGARLGALPHSILLSCGAVRLPLSVMAQARAPRPAPCALRPAPRAPRPAPRAPRPAPRAPRPTPRASGAGCARTRAHARAAAAAWQLPGERPRAIAAVEGARLVQRGPCARGAIAEAGGAAGGGAPRALLLIDEGRGGSAPHPLLPPVLTGHVSSLLPY